MSEQALEVHLESQEQRPPEEMVMVEKSYLEWAGQKITQLEAKLVALQCGDCEKNMLECLCDEESERVR